MKLLTKIFGWGQPKKSKIKDIVAFDEAGLRRILPDGRCEYIAWCELQEIAIVTTDAGPIEEDVYWIFSGDGRGCAIPGSSEGIATLLVRLQTLPGFDNEAVIQAMGSTRNARFVCWRKQ